MTTLKTKSSDEVQLIPNVLAKVNALKKLDPNIKEVRFHENFPKSGLMKDWETHRINRARKTKGEDSKHKKEFLNMNSEGTYDPKNHVAPILVWDPKNECFEVIDGHHRVSGRDGYKTLSFVWCVVLSDDLTDEQRSLILNRIACWGNTNQDLYKRKPGTDEDILEIVKQEINFNPNITNVELKELLKKLKDLTRISDSLFHKAKQLKILKKDPLKCVKNLDKSDRKFYVTASNEMINESMDNSDSYTGMFWEMRGFLSEYDHDHDPRTYRNALKGFQLNVKRCEKKGELSNYHHITGIEVKNANFKEIQVIRDSKKSMKPFNELEELTEFKKNAVARGHVFNKSYISLPQLENENRESYLKELRKMIN